MAGIDLGYSSGTLQLNGFEREFTTDVFNSTYEQAFGEVNYVYNPKSNSNTIKVYLQDQVTLLPNLKLLIGGRYDLQGFGFGFGVFYVGDRETVHLRLRAKRVNL